MIREIRCHLKIINVNCLYVFIYLKQTLQLCNFYFVNCNYWKLKIHFDISCFHMTCQPHISHLTVSVLQNLIDQFQFWFRFRRRKTNKQFNDSVSDQTTSGEKEFLKSCSRFVMVNHLKWRIDLMWEKVKKKTYLKLIDKESSVLC